MHYPCSLCSLLGSTLPVLVQAVMGERPRQLAVCEILPSIRLAWPKLELYPPSNHPSNHRSNQIHTEPSQAVAPTTCLLSSGWLFSRVACGTNALSLLPLLGSTLPVLVLAVMGERPRQLAVCEILPSIPLAWPKLELYPPSIQPNTH